MKVDDVFCNKDNDLIKEDIYDMIRILRGSQLLYCVFYYDTGKSLRIRQEDLCMTDLTELEKAWNEQREYYFLFLGFFPM